VNWIRGFSAQAGHTSGTRNLEDAPQAMRQELVDVFFSVAEHNQDEISPEHVYQVTCQSLGNRPHGILSNGYRHAAGREVMKVDWPRIYDLVSRLWSDFEKQGFGGRLHEGVNRVLAAYGAAWELGEDGRLHRVLPVSAQSQVQAAITELSDPRFEPALALLNAARDAYDDRPRRDRNSCSNIFDALESVAKEKYGMPNATFGQVVAHTRQSDSLNAQIVGLLGKLNDLRNQTFGHGMTAAFSLSGAEVDFTYLTCIGAILLLTRTP